MRIGLLDSGVGGLAVFRELAAIQPEADFFYLSDSAFHPYGLRTGDELTERTVQLVGAMIDQYQLDLCVIACNTASTVCLPALRERFTIPIVGVVPAVKPAAQQTQTGVIAVLATPLTIKSQYLEQLIETYAAHLDVKRVPCASLVALAERKMQGLPYDLQEVALDLEVIRKNAQLDCVVLACTHFSLLTQELADFFGSKVRLIEPNLAIAKRVVSLLPMTPQSKTKRRLFLSTANQGWEKLVPHLKVMGFSEAKILAL